MKKKYAIIDIETTGGQALRHRITEIAIVLHDGTNIIDRFETLLNPECYIPYGITQLTGITQDMVEGAPKFFEIAKKIVEMTEGAIFVAHNVRFDYGFIREEFKRLGYTYTRKQLCTVRLSRQVFPGLRSYSLGILIKHFNIQVEKRHRAMADTMATVELFEKILAKNKSEQQIKTLVNLGIKESLLPKNITLEVLHALPEDCGVYYMHDETGNAAYIGKSINIKKRVADHFSKPTPKASRLQKFVHDITYEITGSELIALLLESHEIKSLRPYINRAQRRRHFPFVVHTFLNDAGYICFDVVKVSAQSREKLQIVAEYPKSLNAKAHLSRAMKAYELCAKYCNMETNRGKGPCFPYHLKQCYGACIEKEGVQEYNERAKAVMEQLSTIFEEDFFIIDKGRSNEERSVVLVENGAFYGFGYLDVSDVNGDLGVLRDAVKPYRTTAEASRIIRRFLSDYPKTKIVKIVAS